MEEKRLWRKQKILNSGQKITYGSSNNYFKNQAFGDCSLLLCGRPDRGFPLLTGWRVNITFGYIIPEKRRKIIVIVQMQFEKRNSVKMKKIFGLA